MEEYFCSVVYFNENKKSEFANRKWFIEERIKKAFKFFENEKKSLRISENKTRTLFENKEKTFENQRIKMAGVTGHAIKSLRSIPTNHSHAAKVFLRTHEVSLLIVPKTIPRIVLRAAALSGSRPEISFFIKKSP